MLSFTAIFVLFGNFIVFSMAQESLLMSENMPRILFTKNEDNLEVDEINSLNRSENEIIEKLVQALLPLRYQQVLVLLNDNFESHRTGETYMKKLLSLRTLNIQFTLMKFNESGVSSILSNSNFQNQFLNSLKWPEESNTTMSISPEFMEQGVMFFATLVATRQLPENGGVLVFTNRGAEDGDLARLALKEMNDKSIKLFVVWDGIHGTMRGEEKILKDVCYLTGGLFLVVNREKKLSQLYKQYYFQNLNNGYSKSLIALGTNITGMQNLSFPIDSSVTSFHISATAPLKSLKLVSPQGHSIDVLNDSQIESFSRGSFAVFDAHLNQYEIHMNTSNSLSTLVTGTWRLDVDTDKTNAQGCNITISVQTHLNVTTHVTYTFPAENALPQKILRLNLEGKYKNIDEITLLDKWGKPLSKNVTYFLKNMEFLKTANGNNIEIPIDNLPEDSVYLNVTGEDEHGKVFSRLSYYNVYGISYLIPGLSVDVSAGSQLFVAPGRYGRILFEVTNNRNQMVYVSFRVQDERSLLRQMQPRAAWLNPRQTIIVTVTVIASSIQTVGYRNLITFTAFGLEQVKKSATMQITNERLSDNTQPKMTHRYSSDCNDLIIGNCRDGTWVIEVTAQDPDSGLLQLTSNPKGLFFPEPYISGTRESVLGIYGGSCCQSKIQLMAIDVLGNRMTYTANAYNASLSAGTISAIVLGILLFIILLILIVICARKTCCKSKESVDLPRYRSPHRSSQTRF